MVNVTIGLPVYNGAEYLDQALASLCGQTYQDLEILISDNASTDKTPDIIREWMEKDSRIKTFRHDKTISMADNFGSVIQRAKGKWFCYAAHDDLWSPNYVEELIKPIEASGNAIISVPSRVLIDTKNNESKKKEYRPPPKNASLQATIRHNFSIVYSAWYYALYNRDAFISLQKSRKYFQKIWGADFAIYIPILFSDKIVGSDKAIFYQRETGISGGLYRPTSASDMYEHYRDFWKELLHNLKQAPLSSSQKILLLGVLKKYASNVVKPRRIIRAFFQEKTAKYKKLLRSDTK